MNQCFKCIRWFESWVEQGRSMGQTGSNHESDWVESWVRLCRIMSQTGLNHESNRSNHESSRVESWVNQGRVISRTGSNHESNTVESWFGQFESYVKLGRIMGRTGWKLYDWHFFDGDTSNFENLAQKFFCFFFQPQINFRTQINIFRKNNFCMQNLIFCVHNVVLDAIKLAFTFFSLNFFFQKRWKFLFLLYGVLMYALINVW